MRNKGRRSGLRWGAIGLGVVVATYFVGVTTWIDQWRGMRQGNDYEEFYEYIAQELDEPAICDKISWAAELPGGFFISRSYLRSACYDAVAGRTRNSWPCWKVRRLGRQSLLNIQTSMFSCLRQVAEGRSSGTALPGESLVHFFKMMGYDPDELHNEGVTRPIVDVRNIYGRLPEEPDILARVGVSLRTHERTNTRTRSDVEDAAYLAQMAALVGKDAGWCERIPSDLPLAGQKQYFRDWCVFTLATNTRDSDLCRRIPIRPYSIARADELPPARVQELTVQMSLQAQCDRQIHSPYPSNTHYAPEFPADDESTRRLIELLGYPIPRASTLPPQRLEEAYRLFLTVLTGADAPLHASARQRLIERVKALPDIGWDGVSVSDQGSR